MNDCKNLRFRFPSEYIKAVRVHGGETFVVNTMVELMRKGLLAENAVYTEPIDPDCPQCTLTAAILNQYYYVINPEMEVGGISRMSPRKLLLFFVQTEYWNTPAWKSETVGPFKEEALATIERVINTFITRGASETDLQSLILELARKYHVPVIENQIVVGGQSKE